MVSVKCRVFNCETGFESMFESLFEYCYKERS